MRAAVFTGAKSALTYYYPLGVFMTIASVLCFRDILSKYQFRRISAETLNRDKPSA